MISGFYKIMPSFIQDFMIEGHKALRLLHFKLFPPKLTDCCSGFDKEIFVDFNKSRKYGPLKKICYAPEVSMFFSRSGMVSPCYASYNDKSSHISQNSIRDIWFNGSFKDIREQHAVCNMHDSCGFCEELMKTRSFGSLLINKYEHYAFSKSEYPTIMEFELSNNCNLSCIMCDSNLSSGYEKEKCTSPTGNLHYGQKFMDELREFIPHLQLAEFTGGDPFMIEEYYQIWEMINELNPNCQILITTNANTMNPRIERLMDSNKNINFNISVDSLQKENYEFIRRNGNFDFAMKNINTFVEYSRKHNTNVNILVCPMTVNVTELAAFVDFANNLDICVFYHTVVKPENLSLKYLDSDSLDRLVQSIELYDFPSSSKKQRTNRENFNNLISLLTAWSDENRIADTETEMPNHFIQYAEAVDVLKIRVDVLKADLLPKFEDLLRRIDFMPAKDVVVNKLIHVSDAQFFDFLENKDLDELTDICKSITDL